MKILDFISKSALQEIQDLFSDATGLAAIAVDIEGNYITEGSNFTEFCMKYTRGSEKGNIRCVKCDTECTGTYFCHAGLMDFSEDIMIDNQKLGAIIGGQVLPEAPDLEKFTSIAKELGIDPQKYLKALSKVPIKTEKSIRASAKLLGQIVNTLVNLNYNTLKDEKKITVIGSEMKQAIQVTDAIVDKTKALVSIASKQNIMALNSTIEAARAGTAGRGFAVVATQMGDLSKKSGAIYSSIQIDAQAIQKSITAINQALTQIQ